MAIVQRETGLPLFAHNYHAIKTASEQIKVFENAKADFNKIIIGHSTNVKDLDYLEEFLRLGCYLGFDRVSFNCSSVAQRVCQLIERGWEDRLLFSHDFSVFIDSQDYTWEDRKQNVLTSDHNLTNVHKRLIPFLREMGVSQGQINKALHDNVIRLMTL